MRRRKACAVCSVRSTALCRALANEELLRLNRMGYHRSYAPGSVIAREDQPQHWFATVLSGVVKLTRTLSDGRRQIVGLLFPKDFVGRPFNGPSPCGAEAATHVNLCCVSRGDFENLIHQAPALKQLFLERTLDEVDAARDWMLLLARKTAKEKVASLLLLFAKRLGAARAERPERIEFQLPLSRTEMAEYLGLTIETVSRKIKELKTAGVVEAVNGRAIRVASLEALERVADNHQHYVPASIERAASGHDARDM